MPFRDEFIPARLMGVCADGKGLGSGVRIHLIRTGHSWDRALCGAIPGGRKSAGWTSEECTRVTCKRCERALAKLPERGD